MQYPLPSYAVSVWLGDSGNLNIAMPGTGPNGAGHRVTLNADEHGYATLHQILRNRMVNPQATIGTPGAPTQGNLSVVAEQLLKEDRERVRRANAEESERKKREAEAFLRDLDL